MASLGTSLSQQARRVACSLGQNAAGWEPFLADGFKAVVPGYAGVLKGINNAGDAISDLACGSCQELGGTDCPGLDLYPDIPFLGGQCVAGYAVNFTWSALFDGTPQGATLTTQAIKGPIEGISSGPNVDGTGVRVVIIHDGGKEFNAVGRGGQPWTEINAKINNVTRPDGKPDNCGNRGGGPPGATIPICYDLPDGTEICKDVPTKPDPPYIDVDGSVIIPVVFDVGGVNITANVNVATGNVNIGIGGGGGGDGPGDPCRPPVAPNPDAEPGDEEPPPPEDDRRFIGVMVYVVSLPPGITATIMGDGNGPEIFAPRIGDISFAMEIADRRGWSVDYPIKKRSQYIPVVGDAVAYDWTIFSRDGATFRVDPLYIEGSSNDE